MLMLKMTATELKLISDIDMHFFKKTKNKWEEEFLTLPKDLVKQIINTCTFYDDKKTK